ncbi:MAG: dUTP diphosphatase [Phycisphaeraceae bacterium]|nr:dUTP diphosphatase [Phycisphaeraceae bacterium]
MAAIPVNIPIKRLPHGRTVNLPVYQSDKAAGMDLCAAIEQPVIIEPNHSALVPCGIAVAIPEGFEGQIRPRSGLATKHLLLIPNSPGTIDADYRGEIMVALLNLGPYPFEITPGMRFAQLVISPVARATWIEAPDLPPTIRGTGGFGHSGA